MQLARELLLLTLGCSVIAAGHTINSKALIAVGLMALSVMVVLKFKRYFFIYLFFLLPFSPILKFTPAMPSFYSLIIAAIAIILLVRHGKSMNKRSVAIILILVFIFLAGKAMTGSSVSSYNLSFLCLMISVTLYLENYMKYISFRSIAVSFSAGIVLSAIMASFLMDLPAMAQYATQYQGETLEVIRLSGFYGDPNYFAAQVTAALAAILVILYYSTSNRLLMVGLLVLLLYVGSFAVSKMFLFVATFCISVWVMLSLFMKDRLIRKLGIIFCIIASLAVLFTSGVFSQQQQMYSERLSRSSDVATLTTGRSDIAQVYLAYFNSHPETLLFGHGYSKVYVVQVSGVASHNTAIQMIYQFGILGTILVVFWFINIGTIVTAHNKRHSYTSRLLPLILMVGTVASFISLDMVFLDDFILLPVLTIIGIAYVKSASMNQKRKEQHE